jgi:hypothetical protein
MRQQVYTPLVLKDLLEKSGVLTTGVDIYKAAAAAMFGITPEEVNAEERLVGKMAVLRLGYTELTAEAKMRQALLEAAEQFEFYASNHKEKSANDWYSPELRSEARAKADVNERWADKCRAAAGFTP